MQKIIGWALDTGTVTEYGVQFFFWRTEFHLTTLYNVCREACQWCLNLKHCLCFCKDTMPLHQSWQSDTAIFVFCALSGSLVVIRWAIVFCNFLKKNRISHVPWIAYFYFSQRYLHFYALLFRAIIWLLNLSLNDLYELTVCKVVYELVSLWTVVSPSLAIVWISCLNSENCSLKRWLRVYFYVTWKCIDFTVILCTVKWIVR